MTDVEITNNIPVQFFSQYFDSEDVIRELIDFTKSQVGLDAPVCVIHGRGMSGKSTIVNVIVRALNTSGRRTSEVRSVDTIESTYHAACKMRIVNMPYVKQMMIFGIPRMNVFFRKQPMGNMFH